jgi:outer membrane lipoprotein-sorting protein
MTILRPLLFLVLPSLLVGCGDSERPPPPPVKDTVFSDMAAAEDKARAVEATAAQHKEDLDKAIKEAE